MFKKFIKKAALMLGTVLLATSIPVSTQSKPKELSKSIKVGDIVTFGKYQKEAVQWNVLDKKENKALIITKDAVDIKHYHKKDVDITWEKCTLRKWLNKEFLDAAFSKNEKKKIESTEVENKDNEDIKGGKDTDKVFLLSIDEAEKYFKSDEKRKATCTKYAIKQLAKIFKDSEKNIKREVKNGYDYWLRLPGEEEDYAAYVNDDGNVWEFGDRVYVYNGFIYEHDPVDFGVRPALWVNL